MGRGAIWRSICAEAWAKTAADLRLQGGRHLMISVFLFSLYAVFVWYIVGEQHALAEVRDRFLLIAAPLAIFPAWWLIRLFLTIPDREITADKRIGLLHTYLLPRLSFELIDEGAPVEFPIGSATKTVGGDLVTNIESYERVICGAVKNTSTKDASLVHARFAELVGNNGKRMRDPIHLYWAPIGSLTDSATVPARGERTLQIFRVTQGGFYFAHTKTPVEYLNFFDGGTKFTGRIVIEEVYHCSLEVHFTLELNGEPRMQIVHTSGASHRTAEQWEAELALMEAANG